MKKYPNINITVQPQHNSVINAVCSDIKMLSEHLNTEITFSFNRVTLTTKNKSIQDMLDQYTTQHT